jgi:hypothetical protein
VLHAIKPLPMLLLPYLHEVCTSEITVPCSYSAAGCLFSFCSVLHAIKPQPMRLLPNLH